MVPKGYVAALRVCTSAPAHAEEKEAVGQAAPRLVPS